MSDIHKAIIKLMGTLIMCGVLVSVYGARKPQDTELEIQVEEICSVMNCSYTSDRYIYEKYHKSEDEEERQEAEQAKVRANKTASKYNKFIEDNHNIIPNEVKKRLDYIY